MVISGFSQGGKRGSKTRKRRFCAIGNVSLIPYFLSLPCMIICSLQMVIPPEAWDNDDSPFVLQVQNMTLDVDGQDEYRGSRDGEGQAQDDGSKQHFIDILKNAGENVTEDIEAKLPTWGQVKDLYGPKPIILGLDTCQAYQNDPNIAPVNRSIAVAGLMNTGTHMLHKILKENCHMPDRKFDFDESYFQKEGSENQDTMKATLAYLTERRDDLESGILFDVPWNKHAPEYFRSRNFNYEAKRRVIYNEHVLPVIVVKDPYHWFHSMCRHPYIVRFFGSHSKDTNRRHCPILVPNEADGEDAKAANVKIRRREGVEKHESFAHYWNEWNDAYVHQDEAKSYPRVIVRYEDLLVHLHDTVTKICECAGGQITTEHVRHMKDTAKTAPGHTHQKGLASAMMRYLHDEPRTKPSAHGGTFYMTFDDVEYAKEELDPELMKIFGYKHPKRTRENIEV